MTIDLEVLTKGQVRNLSGHPRGVAARELFEFDQSDRTEGQVEIVFPDYLLSVAPSFVQGLLAESYQYFGNEEQFRAHFKFVASRRVLAHVERGLRQIFSQGRDRV